VQSRGIHAITSI